MIAIRCVFEELGSPFGERGFEELSLPFGKQGTIGHTTGTSAFGGTAVSALLLALFGSTLVGMTAFCRSGNPRAEACRYVHLSPFLHWPFLKNLQSGM
jgi:hypothetical protein